MCFLIFSDFIELTNLVCFKFKHHYWDYIRDTSNKLLFIPIFQFLCLVRPWCFLLTLCHTISVDFSCIKPINSSVNCFGSSLVCTFESPSPDCVSLLADVFSFPNTFSRPALACLITCNLPALRYFTLGGIYHQKIDSLLYLPVSLRN